MKYRVVRRGETSQEIAWKGDDPIHYHGALGCCDGEYGDDGPETVVLSAQRLESGEWAEMPIAEFDQLRGLGK